MLIGAMCWPTVGEGGIGGIKKFGLVAKRGGVCNFWGEDGVLRLTKQI